MLPLITLIILLSLISPTHAHDFTEPRTGTISKQTFGCTTVKNLLALVETAQTDKSGAFMFVFKLCHMIEPNTDYLILQHSEDHLIYKVRFLKVTDNNELEFMELYVGAPFLEEKSQ